MTTTTFRPGPTDPAARNPRPQPPARGRRPAPLLCTLLALTLTAALLAPATADAGASGSITVTIRIVSNRIDVTPAGARDGQPINAAGAEATSAALAAAVERCADSLAERGLGHLREQVREQFRTSALVVTPDGAYSVGAESPAWVVDSTTGARSVVSL